MPLPGEGLVISLIVWLAVYPALFARFRSIPSGILQNVRNPPLSLRVPRARLQFQRNTFGCDRPLRVVSGCPFLHLYRINEILTYSPYPDNPYKMNYQRISPSRALAHLVDFHEVVEVDIPDPHFAFLSFNHPAEQGISMFYRLNGRGLHQQVGNKQGLAYAQGKIYVQSVSTRGTVHRVQGQVGYLRTFFKPGKLEHYLGTPLAETTDRLLTLEDFGLKGVRALQDQLMAENSVRARVDCMEHHLLRRSHSVGPEKELIQYLTDALRTGRNFSSVAELCTFFGYSTRHLQRIFLEQIGIAPKAFLRMLRIRQVIRALESRTVRSLTQLAYEFGFADQAHFCREFKTFMGSSPGQYRRRVDPSFAQRSQVKFIGLAGQVRD